MKKEQQLNKIFQEMEDMGLTNDDCGLFDFKHVDPNNKQTFAESMRILSSGEKNISEDLEN